jgi:hypothetical protein
LLTSHMWELIECSSRILTDSPQSTFYEARSGSGAGARDGRPVSPSTRGGGGGGGGGVVDDSASDGSASDDVPMDGEGEGVGGEVLSSRPHVAEAAPHYRANIECFHTIGGFDAIIDRISREPALTFTNIRILLRPMFKVRAPTSAVAAHEPLAHLPPPPSPISLVPLSPFATPLSRSRPRPCPPPRLVRRSERSSAVHCCARSCAV